VAGLRNLLAHQFGALDHARVYIVARDGRADLASYCATPARISHTPSAADAETPVRSASAVTNLR